MLKFWGRPLSLLGSLSVMGLMLGWLTNPVWGLSVYSGVLLVLVGYHLRQLAAFKQWLVQPELDSVPEGSGTWALVFSALRQQVKLRVQIEHRLQQELTRFERGWEAMPDGVVVLDKNGHVEWCNPKAQEHLGLDPEHDAGRQITNVVRQPAFVSYLAQGDAHEPLLLRVNRIQPLLLSLQMVAFGETQKLLITRDITDLERAQLMRRDFVANVSHELRTPLTVVGGFLETMLDMDESAMDAVQMRQYWQIMLAQSQRMQRLVEDLLTLSKLENEDHPLKDEPFAVGVLLELIHREGQSLSHGRHTLTLSLQDPVCLVGNRDELHSAFGNLVSNAIRYTLEGGKIGLSWQVLANGQGVFSVTDTGIGIAPQHISRLTERFYRVDRSRSRETGGTGLGLAIVKHVLTRHQASLHIQSDLGVGSTFSVEFPAQRILPIQPE